MTANRKIARPTIKSVAAEAGVSVATVSYVLRNIDKGIPERTAERVRAAAEKLGYRPNRAAQAMRTGETHLVALSLTMMSDPWSIAIMEAIGAASRAAGRSAIVLADGAWKETIPQLQPDVTYIDNVNPLSGDLDELIELVNAGHRVVLYAHRNVEPQGFDVVFSNADFAMAELVDHVVEQTNDVAFLTLQLLIDRDFPRFRAYARAVADGQILTDRTLTYDGSRADAFRVAIDLLSGENPPRAIMANTDFAALAVIQAALFLGKRVPEDVIVTGFGNSREATESSPQLTSAGPENFYERLADVVVAAASRSKRLGETHEFTWRTFLRDSSVPPAE